MSTREIETKLTVRGVDKLTGPLGKMSGAAGKFGAKAKRELGQLQKLRGPVKLIEDFRKAESHLGKSATKMRTAQQRAKELGQAFKNATRPTTKMRVELERAQSAARKASSEFKANRAALRDNREALKTAGISVKNLADKERELASAVGKVNSRLDTNYSKFKKVTAQQKQWAEAKRKLDESLNRATGLTATGYTGIHTGRRVLSGLKNPVDEAKRFEEEMQGVRAVTRTFSTSAMKDKDRTVREAKFQALRKQALDLGASTSFTNAEAARGQYYLGAAGMTSKEIISAMPSVLSLAKAGRTDLAKTSEISAGILRGYKLEAGEMGRVADTLVGTFTRSKVSVKDIGETLGYVGPNAQQAGVELEYVAAATGKLGDANIMGSRAGTALRAVISRLAGPPKMAEKALAKLGVATKDAEGNMRPMATILDELHAAMQKYGNAERLEFGKQIAGEEAASGFAVLLDRKDEIVALANELKRARGEATEISKVMGDVAKGDEDRLGSAWSALKTEIGTQLLPDYRELLRTTTELINAGREWAKANPELTKTIALLAGSVGTLLVVGGGAAFALAGVVGSVALLKATFRAGSLVRAFGTFGSALDDYSTKADRAAKKTRSLGSASRKLMGKAAMGGVLGALALMDDPGIKKVEDVTAEDRKRIDAKHASQEQWARDLPIIGDLYKWGQSARSSLGLGQSPGAGLPIRDDLASKQQRLQAVNAQISSGGGSASLEAERSQLSGEIDGLTARIRQAEIDKALQAQAMGVRSAPLAQALAEKAAQIRSVNVSGGAVSKPVDGQRALGGPGYAGASYEVNEDGTEIATFAKNGRVLSRKDSMAAVAGRGGGEVFAPQITISGGGMDPAAIAQAVRAEIERLWRDQKMSSFHNSEFA
ncbi:phage tail tape measure protein [Cohaesibacter sp. CAU 1516]|uniref:phage tail tape measure protein n=1 Tax=Cohaesibacter sp. CAU 1516 TaxID=2576038 RepID=UPI0010FDEAE2|nr:phage tail tape measure protein [Cohaesibacter sp. CAU 1516]TLP42685.1 phage tail tape measure protein [Cohaesibacter sp. CAU 1516]